MTGIPKQKVVGMKNFIRFACLFILITCLCVSDIDHDAIWWGGPILLIACCGSMFGIYLAVK